MLQNNKGATRGIGKGIALQLGENGAKVYVTGRTLNAKKGGLGSLEETCDEVGSIFSLAIQIRIHLTYLLIREDKETRWSRHTCADRPRK